MTQVFLVPVTASMIDHRAACISILWAMDSLLYRYCSDRAGSLTLLVAHCRQLAASSE